MSGSVNLLVLGRVFNACDVPPAHRPEVHIRQPWLLLASSFRTKPRLLLARCFNTFDLLSIAFCIQSLTYLSTSSCLALSRIKMLCYTFYLVLSLAAGSASKSFSDRKFSSTSLIIEPSQLPLQSKLRSRILSSFLGNKAKHTSSLLAAYKIPTLSLSLQILSMPPRETSCSTNSYLQIILPHKLLDLRPHASQLRML